MINIKDYMYSVTAELFEKEYNKIIFKIYEELFLDYLDENNNQEFQNECSVNGKEILDIIKDKNIKILLFHFKLIQYNHNLYNIVFDVLALLDNINNSGKLEKIK